MGLQLVERISNVILNGDSGRLNRIMLESKIQFLPVRSGTLNRTIMCKKLTGNGKLGPLLAFFFKNS